VANMALRCTVEVGATGRSPRAGRPSPSPGRRVPGRRGPLLPVERSPPLGRPPPLPPGPPSDRAPSGRDPPERSPAGPRSLRGPLRSRRSSPSSSSRRRDRLPEPGARITETSGARLGVPTTSIRPSVFSSERNGLAEESARTAMPSSPISTSARRMVPTAPPTGTNSPLTRPFGWRAPAARQVQVPSSLLLVNSISIRRDMRRTRYRAVGAGRAAEPSDVMPGLPRHPVI